MSRLRINLCMILLTKLNSSSFGFTSGIAHSGHVPTAMYQQVPCTVRNRPLSNSQKVPSVLAPKYIIFSIFRHMRDKFFNAKNFFANNVTYCLRMSKWSLTLRVKTHVFHLFIQFLINANKNGEVVRRFTFR